MGELFQLVLSMSLSASLLIALLLVLRPLYRGRFSKMWQYYVWLIVLLRLIVPFTPGFAFFDILFQPDSQSAAVIQTDHQPAQAGAENPDILPAADGGFPVPPQEEPVAGAQPYAAFWQMAGSVWLAGALLALLIKGWRYMRYVHGVRGGARAVTGESRAALLADLAAEAGIRNAPAFYESAYIRSPMLLGLWNPAVFLPETMQELRAEGLSYVFRHELTHYRRGDLFYKWFTELVLCIHWFNPLVYAMREGIDRLCELSCDKAVAKGLNQSAKKEYGKILLLTALETAESWPHPLATTFCDNKSSLKERLSAILKAGRVSRKVMLLSAAAAIALCGTAFCLGASSFQDAWNAVPMEQVQSGQGETDQELPPGPASSDKPEDLTQDEEEVRTLAEAFGQALKMVSLLAPQDEAAAGIGQYYGGYVTPELLKQWQDDPAQAPGRVSSSPWPERIDILSMEWASDTECLVTGKIIEVTSVELTQGGAAAKRPVTLTVRKTDDYWRISGVVLGAYEE